MSEKDGNKVVIEQWQSERQDLLGQLQQKEQQLQNLQEEREQQVKCHL